MESARAEKLVARYFEGETTLLEEAQLRDYFMSGTVATHLESYAPLFKAFAQARKETYDQPVTVPSNKSYLLYISSIASVVVLAIGLYLQSTHTEVYRGTYESEEVAILKTKQTLGMMSQMLSNSTARLEVVEEFDKASSTLFK